MNLALELNNLHKTYLDGAQRISVIDGINLKIDKGEFVSIQGASGSGKSTLLNLIGSLDRPDSGKIIVNSHQLDDYFKDGKIHMFRMNEIGFVFQNHYLLADFTLIDNIILPLLLQKVDKKLAVEQGEYLLEKVKLFDRRKHFPYQISGGESQRAAFARAIIHKPALLLADEPTGNLDSANTNRFVDILGELQREFQQTVLLVTHENDLASRARLRYHMQDGKLFQV